MRLKTLDKLDLLAAEAEARLREDIARQNAALRQIEHQKRVLADYRERLAETWRHGGVVFAGQALRAETFVTASGAAAAKIETEEPRARQRLEEALQNLAKVQERRRGLQEARRKQLALEEREIERILSREQFRRHSNGGVTK